MSDRDPGKMPDIDQELEKLRKLGILKEDYLDGLYNDLFSSGAQSSGTSPAGTARHTSSHTPYSTSENSFKNNPAVSREKCSGNCSADRPENLPENTPGHSQENRPGSLPEASPEAPRGPIAGTDPASTPDAIPGKAPETAAGCAAKEAGEEKDPMEELDALIGLETIKHDVRELTDFVRIQKLRANEGLKSVPVSLHLVFTGNPGTGKTTVARILAKLYRRIGVLSKGQLIETDRSGLVAGYVGQTALKTQEQIEKALGGVLFIDEAYALAQKDDAFGQEAIDTLLKAMEDHRDDLVVIVAGYTRPMEKFINSNPGLKSRFNKYIEFPDYSVDELMDIFKMNCRKYDYIPGEGVEKHVRELITARKLEKTENFANAREVRNLFEEIITNQAGRVASLKNVSQMDMMTIDMEDLAGVVQKAGSAGQKAKDKDGAAGDTIKSTGENAEDTIKNADGSAKDTAKNTGGNAKDTAKNTDGNAKDTVKNAGGNAGQK